MAEYHRQVKKICQDTDRSSSRATAPARVTGSGSPPQLDVTRVRAGLTTRPLKHYGKTKSCLKLCSPGSTMADERREIAQWIGSGNRERKFHITVRLRYAFGSTAAKEDNIYIRDRLRPCDDGGQLFVAELHGRP